MSRGAYGAVTLDQGDGADNIVLDRETVAALKNFLFTEEVAVKPLSPQYAELARVLNLAYAQADSGKGKERHALVGEAFQDQKIVQLGEWMDSTAFAVGQACKKGIESTRLPPDRAILELLGAINYLAAAVIQIERSQKSRG